MECAVFKTYAHGFLDSATTRMIDEARCNLQSIKVESSAVKTTRWSIPEDRPLYTAWSNGESKPDKKSAHHVRGEFSFVWQIRPLDERPFLGRSHFVLDGLASTLVKIVDKDDQCIAKWSVDVGDHQSPGIHFHSQVIQVGGVPSNSLDIPRFPAILMSPFLVLEFAIGELFQDRWRRHATTDSKGSRDWRGIHKPRLERFYSWQLEQVSSDYSCTPWMRLKLAKPAPDLLVKKL